MSGPSLDMAKYLRLTTQAEVESSAHRAMSELCAETGARLRFQLGDIRDRMLWHVDDPRRALSLSGLLALPEAELRSAGLDRVSVARAKLTEDELAAYRQRHGEASARLAPLQTLVRRLKAHVGGELGEIKL